MLSLTRALEVEILCLFPIQITYALLDIDIYHPLFYPLLQSENLIYKCSD